MVTEWAAIGAVSRWIVTEAAIVHGVVDTVGVGPLPGEEVLAGDKLELCDQGDVIGGDVWMRTAHDVVSFEPVLIDTSQDAETT